MNKTFEKILERLEEERELSYADFSRYVDEVSPCLDAEYDDFFHRGLERASSLVKEVAEEYTSTNSWISCSSGNMPNNGQKVYVEFNDGKHMCLVYRTKDSRDKSNGWEMNITQDGFYEICSDYGYMPYRNIIAWQPLPEPFKERD